jgi:diaminohydroxyphosphoribosylaminopyrimidine deaminase / 5-amino-6-(5-phosphoribosylamino)uracil reductase
MNPAQFTIPPEAKKHMAHALRLARKGLGRTDPNPMVGAVVVNRGHVVGQGFHRAVGKPHAEVEAIRDARENARGAELFVTLEPCNHYGRTPPCTEAIREAGIGTVWYGMKDPNPGVSGGGADTLKDMGIRVIGGLFERRCRRLNEVFLTNVTDRRPFVYLKLGMSLDGRIATRTGHSQWITSEQSRAQVHRLRDRVSGVMVGIGTVLADNPSLTTRLPRGRGVDAIRIIADSSLRTPPESKVVKSDSSERVIIACRKSPPGRPRKRLEEAGAIVLPTSSPRSVDLSDVLSGLYEEGITSLLLEGGARLAWGGLEAGLVDRCIFYYSPMIIGGDGAKSGVGGKGIDQLLEAPRLRELETTRVGTDIRVSGLVSYSLREQEM